MNSVKPSTSLDALAAGNRVLLLGVTVTPGGVTAAIGFFEARLPDEPIMIGDNGANAFWLTLPPEAVSLRGRSRAYRVTLPYASIPNET
jgi:hypothetical protein